MFHMCFFNDTAAPEIYTYGPTLSLHDALPICRLRLAPQRDGHDWLASGSPLAAERWTRHGQSSALFPRLRRWQTVKRVMRRRSEEHTSEPQSLMRISYAVFCLQKKNTAKRYATQKINKLTRTLVYHIPDKK